VNGQVFDLSLWEVDHKIFEEVQARLRMPFRADVPLTVVPMTGDSAPYFF